MYFCPHCDTLFDIIKVTDNQRGGAVPGQNNNNNEINYDKLINDIVEDVPLDKNFDPTKINMDLVVQNQEYKKLRKGKKQYVTNFIQDLLPKENKELYKNNAGEANINDKVFFKCKNCGFMKKVEDRTLIYSRVSSDISQSYATSDFSTMVHSDILPRTRKYICPNSKCESQDDPSKREAVFFRMNNTFNVKHICTACNTSF